LRAGDRRAWLIALLTMAIAGSGVSAHRLDEYLQAARIAIEPDRADVELDLTPGIAVAEGVIAGIDRDGDGSLSAAEQRAYVARVLGAVAVDLDGRALGVQPINAAFPEPDALRRGDAAIRLQARAVLPPLAAGRHQLRFRNANDRDVGVYLANALVPVSDRIGVTAQRRDRGQTELTIDFVAAAPATSMSGWLLCGVAGLLALAWFVTRWWESRGVRQQATA
jgi:hypothetical protein